MATDLGGLYYSLGVKTDSLKKDVRDISKWITDELSKGVEVHVTEASIDENKVSNKLRSAISKIFKSIQNDSSFGITTKLSQSSMDAIDKQCEDIRKKLKSIGTVDVDSLSFTPKVSEESKVTVGDLKKNITDQIQKFLDKPEFQPVVKFRLEQIADSSALTQMLRNSLAGVQNEINTITKGIDASILKAQDLIKSNGLFSTGGVNYNFSFDEKFKPTPKVVASWRDFKGILKEIEPTLEALAKSDTSNLKAFNDIHLNIDFSKVGNDMIPARQLIDDWAAKVESEVKPTIHVDVDTSATNGILEALEEFKQKLTTIPIEVKLGNGNKEASTETKTLFDSALKSVQDLVEKFDKVKFKLNEDEQDLVDDLNEAYDELSNVKLPMMPTEKLEQELVGRLRKLKEDAIDELNGLKGVFKKATDFHELMSGEETGRWTSEGVTAVLGSIEHIQDELERKEGLDGVEIKLDTDSAHEKLIRLRESWDELVRKFQNGTEVKLTLPENLSSLENIKLSEETINSITETLNGLELTLNPAKFNEEVEKAKTLLKELSDAAQLMLGVTSLEDVVLTAKAVATANSEKKTTKKSEKTDEEKAAEEAQKQADEATKLANKVETKISGLRAKLTELTSLQSQSLTKGVDTKNIDDAIGKVKTLIDELTTLQGNNDEHKNIIGKFDSGEVDVLLAHVKELVAKQKEVNANKVKPVAETSSQETAKAVEETVKATEEEKKASDAVEESETKSIDKLTELIQLQTLYIARLKEQQALVKGKDDGGLAQTIERNKILLGQMKNNVGDEESASKWLSDNYTNIDVVAKKFEPILNIITQIDTEIAKLEGRKDFATNDAVGKSIEEFEKFRGSLAAVIKGSSALTTSISGLNREWTTLKANASKEINVSKNLADEDKAAAKLEERNRKAAEQMALNIDAVIRSVQDKKGALDNALIVNPDSNSLKNGIQAYDDLITRLNRLKSSGTATAAALEPIRQEIVKIKNETRQGLTKEGLATSEATKWAKVESSLAKVMRVEASLNANKIKFDAKGLGVENITTALEKVRDLKEQINNFKAAGDIKGYESIRTEVEKTLAYINRITAAEIAENNAAIQVANANKQAAREAEKHAKEEEKAANAAARHLVSNERLHNSLLGNLSLMQSLGTQLSNVYSIYTLENFFKKLVEIGGEIEKQKLAMAAILGSQAKTETLFGQLKSLAVKSPFGLLDLTSFAKQLTSYGIQYDELYDTMKRLADISAGVGVDMGRIVLAYGQIRAAKFLKGTELRQLTEANIPMVDALADHFTKLTGKMVSAGEVMDMISKKKVGFEDVKEVLWKMTGEGGQFNNMQEVLSESVSAKYKNLGDAIDILYNNIADSTNSVLKAPAEILTKLVNNWYTLIPVLLAVGSRLIGVKGQQLMLNSTIGSNTAEIYKNIIANKKLEAEELKRIARVRELTETERTRLRNSKNLTIEDLKTAQKDGLKKDQLLLIGSVSGIPQKELEEFFKTMNTEAPKTIGTWKKLGNAIGSVFSTIKSFLWGNALIIGLMAVAEGVGYLISRYFKLSEQAEKAKASLEDVASATKKVFASLHKDTSGLGDLEINEEIKKMVQNIKDNAPFLANEVNKIFALNDDGTFKNSVRERHDMLYELMHDYEKAAEVAKKVNSSDAFNASDEWYGDTVFKNAKQELESQEELARKIVSIFRKNNKITQDALAEFYKMKPEYSLNKTYQSLADTLVGDPNTIRENLDTIASIYKKKVTEIYFSSKRASESARSYAAKLMTFYDTDYQNALTDFVHDSKETANDIEKIYNGVIEETKKNPRFDLLNDKEKTIALQLILNTAFQNASGDASKAVQDIVREKLEHRFGITLDVDTNFVSEEAKNVWQAMWGTEADTYSEGIKEMRKKRKEALEKLEVLTAKDNKKYKHLNDFAIEGKGTYDLEAARKSNIKGMAEYIQEYTTVKSEIATLERDLQAEGQALDEPSKNKGKQEDTWLKERKEELDELKKAFSEYKKWADVVGQDKAIEELKKIVNFDQFKKYGIKPEDIYDEESFNKALQKMYDKIKGQLKGTDREKFDTQFKVELSNVKFTGVQKASQELAKNIQEEVNDAIKQWDLYNTWFEATGNKDLSLSMAFSVKPIETDESKYFFDELERNLEREVKKGNLKELDLGNLLNMNYDSGTAETFYDKAGMKAYYSEWQKVKELMASAGYEYSKKMADLSKQFATYKESIARIDGLLDDQKDKIQKMLENGSISESQADRFINGLTLNADWEKLQKSPEYLAYFNNIYSMTIDKAIQIGNAIKKNLDDKLKAGTISAEDYYKEIERINNQLDKLQNRKSLVVTFATEGLNGLAKQLSENAESKYQSATADVQKYSEILSEAQEQYRLAMNGNDAAAQNVAKANVQSAQSQVQGAQAQQSAASSAMQGAKGMASTVGIIDMIVNGINNTVQGIQKTIQEIDEMRESYGEDTSKTSTGKSIWSTYAKSSQAAADGWNSLKNGDLGGTIAGVVGSWTKIFQGINEYIDGSLNDTIEESKEKLEGLESVLNRIDSKYGSSITAASTAVTKISSSYEQLIKQMNGLGSELGDGKKEGYGLFADGGTALLTTLEGNISGIQDKIVELSAKANKKVDYQSLFGFSPEWAIGASMGNMYTAIAGSAIGTIIAAINAISSAKAARELDKYQAELYATVEAINALKKAGITDTSMQNADNISKYVAGQYAGLIQQRYELEKQLGAEEAKKNTDEDSVKDYQDKIAELNDQIAEFANTVSKELYELDLEGWANDIGDALMNAFANGEDAMEAFTESAQQLMQKVVKNMMIQGIIAPWVQNLQKKYFGDETTKGMFDMSDVQGSIKRIIVDLNNEVNTNGLSIVDALQQMYDGVNSSLGGALDSSNSSSVSNSIKGISEETADVLAALVQGIRLDTSKEVELLQRITAKICDETTTEEDNTNLIAQAQLTQLQQIASHTLRNAEAAEAMRETLDAVVNGTKAWNIQ